LTTKCIINGLYTFNNSSAILILLHSTLIKIIFNGPRQYRGY